jgi:hypothetical protein
MAGVCRYTDLLWVSRIVLNQQHVLSCLGRELVPGANFWFFDISVLYQKSKLSLLQKEKGELKQNSREI